MIRRQQTRTRRYPKIKFCFFCTGKIEPSINDIETLKKFVSERGKILSRLRSGLCKKHQSALTKAVKQARFLALLPFIVRPS